MSLGSLHSESMKLLDQTGDRTDGAVGRLQRPTTAGKPSAVRESSRSAGKRTNGVTLADRASEDGKMCRCIREADRSMFSDICWTITARRAYRASCPLVSCLSRGADAEVVGGRSRVISRYLTSRHEVPDPVHSTASSLDFADREADESPFRPSIAGPYPEDTGLNCQREKVLQQEWSGLTPCGTDDNNGLSIEASPSLVMYGSSWKSEITWLDGRQRAVRSVFHSNGKLIKQEIGEGRRGKET